MIAVEFTFNISKTESLDAFEIRDLIETYLGGLSIHGHIWGEYIISMQLEKVVAYARLSHPHGLKKKYLTNDTVTSLEKIKHIFKTTPDVRILDTGYSEDVPDWRGESFLYLYSHALVSTSPICLGSSGEPLPIYFLPLKPSVRERAYFWSSAYTYHEGVWLGSGELELPAYKQRVEPGSGLSREGRDICKLVEEQTGIPTYYYLDRFWGREKGESKRLCPGCGKTWRIRKNISAPETFSNFRFLCKPCRLVSNDAVDCSDEERAVLGEYSGSE